MNIAQQSLLSDQEEQRRTHTVRNVFHFGIGTLFGLALFARVRTAIGMRSGDQTTIDKKRNFNKRWNNRFTMTVG